MRTGFAAVHRRQPGSAATSGSSRSRSATSSWWPSAWLESLCATVTCPNYRSECERAPDQRLSDLSDNSSTRLQSGVRLDASYEHFLDLIWISENSGTERELSQSRREATSVDSKLRHDIDLVTTTEGCPEAEKPHHEVVMAFFFCALI